MTRIRKVAVAVGTFSLALGVGFVMQNGDVLAARFGTTDHHPPEVAQDDAGPLALPAEPALAIALPHPPVTLVGGADAGSNAGTVIALPTGPVPVLLASDLILVSTPGPELAGMNAITDEPSGQALAALTLDEAPAADLAPQVIVEENCRTVLQAEVLPAGLVGLHLSSPCAPLARVSFLHQGMMFTELTDAGGHIDLTVPALAGQALFLADVTGASGAVAMADVPEVAELDRAVLQWQGAPGMNLRALEFGADYGSDGDVWAGAPRNPGMDGGFLIELGDPSLDQAQLAQVYTFPGAAISRSGDVTLSVEIEVTADNCGRNLAAQSLQIAPGAEIVAHDLTLSVPGCDNEGDLLVVSGMLADLHLAAN